MSIFKKDTIIATFPACDVVMREKNTAGVTQLTYKERLVLSVDAGEETYSMGSAASYALQYNECPIEAYGDAISRGHDTQWVSLCSVTISSQAQTRQIRVLISLDGVYNFEGVLFKFEKTHNSNLKMVVQ